MTRIMTILAIVSAIATVPGAAYAQAERCEWPPPEVRVIRLSGPGPAIDASLSKDDIEARRAARGASAAPKLRFGYYEASAEFIYRAELQGKPLASGNICLAIKTLEVEFGIRTRRILIARELSQHPCFLGHVTRNEQKHAGVDDKLVAEFLPRIDTALKETWNSGLGVEAADEADGLTALKGRIDARLSEIRVQFVSTRDEAQDKIDAEDFARDALPPACRDELIRLLGSRP